MQESQNELASHIIYLVNNSNISSIKQIVTEILRIIKDERSSAKDLKDVIEQDPPLCAKLLRLANSAYYGYCKKINSIKEAIVCIGFNAVKELALNQKVCELFRGQDVINGYSRESLWQHSLAVAICSKMIFRREFRQHGNDIYIAGLLHDLGILVEEQFFKDQFKKVMAEFKVNKRSFSEIEKENLQIDHAEIGKIIADEWGFPKELSNSIAFHANPENVDKDDELWVRTLYIANHICQRENIGFIREHNIDEAAYLKCLSKLNISPDAIEIIVRYLQEELKKISELWRGTA